MMKARYLIITSCNQNQYEMKLLRHDVMEPSDRLLKELNRSILEHGVKQRFKDTRTKYGC
jgi:hypothetical protein